MYSNTGEDMFCFNEDFYNNLLETTLELSPTLFRKSGKDAKFEIKQINELCSKLCQTGAANGTGNIMANKRGERYNDCSEVGIDHCIKVLYRN